MSGLVGYANSDSDLEAEAEDAASTRHPAHTQAQKSPPRGLQLSRTQIEQTTTRQSKHASTIPAPKSGSGSGSTSHQPPSDAASTQTALHNLTLPPVPNLDIPPSPPGSPSAATEAKVTQFLALKQQGVHFNAKLAGSASLRNPALLGKLVAVAGLGPEELYGSSLPRKIWDPMGLRMEQLSGKDGRKKGVEFVRGRE